MKQQAQLPPLTQDLVDAFFASATLWLVRLMGVLFNPRADQRKRRLTRLVQFAERWVEHILFIAAGQRLGVVLGQRRFIAQRIFRSPGVRIATGSNRLLWKSARIKLRGRDLIARVSRLLEALAHPEAYVAHYMKRLAHGLCFRRLIAFAPQAQAVISFGAVDAPIADTS